MTRKPRKTKTGPKKGKRPSTAEKPAAKARAKVPGKADAKAKAPPPRKPKRPAGKKRARRTATAPERRDPAAFWLDEPRNVTKIVWTLVAVCVLLFVADAFYEKHPYFAAEEWFGFYGGFGFVMCVGLVLGAKWMRTVIMRDEDYYDRQP